MGHVLFSARDGVARAVADGGVAHGAHEIYFVKIR